VCPRLHSRTALTASQVFFSPFWVFVVNPNSPLSLITTETYAFLLQKAGSSALSSILLLFFLGFLFPPGRAATLGQFLPQQIFKKLATLLLLLSSSRPLTVGTFSSFFIGGEDQKDLRLRLIYLLQPSTFEWYQTLRPLLWLPIYQFYLDAVL